MFNDIIQQVYLKRFSNAQTRRLAGVILVFAAIFAHEAKAQDLVLQNITISTTRSFSASNSITAGPNFTITSSGDATLTSPSVALKPRFFIIRGGKLLVISQTVAVNVKTENPAIPDEFIVHQNFPNPFNPTTQITYALPKAEKVEIVVYNIFGQEVKKLISEYQAPGYHSVVWDGTDNRGQRTSSGVYYYKVTAGKYNVTKKMTLIQ